MIWKKDIEQIKNLKGNARGQAVFDVIQAISIIEGKEGLERLFEKLKELDCWVKEFEDFQKNIRLFDWYPLWYCVLPIVVAVELFNWDKEKIRQTGIYAQKVSFFEKILVKYFISVRFIAKTVGERWEKHFNVGRLETIELKEKKIVIRLRNFLGHPSFCGILSGYFQSALTAGVGPAKCDEIKCVFKGDPYHEFLLTWE